MHFQPRQPPAVEEPAPPPDGDEAALVAAILQNDRKATADFVARYADDLYSYIRPRLAPQYDQIEDLVQEVFLAAWDSLANYRAEASLLAWLRGIARHKVQDYYREQLRKPVSIGELDQDPATGDSEVEFHRFLDRDQMQKNTRGALAALPEQYRLALLWRYWDKASAREMAAKTGKTEKAIERLLARARAEFRERWNHGQPS